MYGLGFRVLCVGYIVRIAVTVSQGTPTCPAMLLAGSATLGSLGVRGSGLLPVQAIHPGIGNC